jgi:antitoxin ParD1/3/4
MASLRLPEAHEMKLKALRAAIIEGEQSGASRPFDLDAFISRKRRKSRRGATDTA